jgi:opacity protein-like surface antigen
VLPVALAGAEEGAATEREVEAAASRAESAAAEARSLLDRLRRGGPVEAEEAVPSTEAPVRSREPLPVAEPGSPAEARSGKVAEDPGAETLRRAIEEAEAASEAARTAAEEARAVANEARAVAKEARAEMQAYRNRYGRTGPLLGVAGFYAVESFDSASGLEIDDSFGGALIAGYRVHRHVSIEVRGEYLDGFDIGPQGDPSASMLDAEIDGFLITAGPKLYPFTGVLQPFIGLGLGAMRAELKGRASDGARFSDDETDVVIRPAAGLDFYISENLVLNLEAAYVSPGGSLQDIDFATFSSGLTFRF